MKKERTDKIIKLRIVFALSCFLFSLFFFWEKTYAFTLSQPIADTVYEGTGTSPGKQSNVVQGMGQLSAEGITTLQNITIKAVAAPSPDDVMGLYRCNDANMTSGCVQIIDSSTGTLTREGQYLQWNFTHSVVGGAYYYFQHIFDNNKTAIQVYGCGSGICTANYFTGAANLSAVYWGINGEIPLDNDMTRIISVRPAEGETVSTSTPVELEVVGYANSDENFPLRLDYTLFGYNSLRQTFFGNLGEFEYVIEEAGEFTFNATTEENFETGNYMSNITLRTNCVDLWVVDVTCFGIVSNINGQVATSTDWVAGGGTALGNSLQTMFQAIDEVIMGESTATTTLSYKCNPLNWDPVDCVTGLFIPDMGRMIGITSQGMYNVLEDKIPFGFYTQINNKVKQKTASSTLAAEGDVVINIEQIGMASTTVFSWSAARTFMHDVIGGDVVTILIWCEWIMFSGYVLTRLGTKVL